jgi:hypothetical protein
MVCEAAVQLGGTITALYTDVAARIAAETANVALLSRGGRVPHRPARRRWPGSGVEVRRKPLTLDRLDLAPH